MKWVRKVAIMLTILSFLGSAAMTAYAVTNVYMHGGLEIVVTMDRERYDPHEPIAVSIVATNVSDDLILVNNLEQLIPEGYILAEGSEVSVEEKMLLPGENISLDVYLLSESANTEDATDASFWDTLIYGKTFGLPNILLWLIGIAAFAIFMYLT